jgi:hypothetical protein
MIELPSARIAKLVIVECVAVNMFLHPFPGVLA